ncbi:MAG: pirin family protein [Bdellovibrionales bacterium]|nr:pirin family protein [Bdellovibrionales bacterium]
MITLRKSQERGHANHGWLDANHSFSFANYYDPEHMGFSVLRVINEDRIAPGMGFGTHGHNDMEILTYIVEGSLQHRDSMGNTEVIKPGEVQQMSAGTGVRHSEFNPDPNKPTHLLQIWILPDRAGYKPKYGQTSFADRLSLGDFVLTASRTGRDGSISLNQDVDMYVVKSPTAGQKTYELQSGRNAWVQVVNGSVKINDKQLGPGDGAAITKENILALNWAAQSEFIFFDLP